MSAAGPGDDGDGLAEGLESSQGDPRVLFVLNAVLSTAFALMLVWGASLIGVVEWRLTTVAAAALALFVLTYLMTQS